MEHNPSADIRRKVKLSDGREIEVRRLTLKGVIELTEAIKEAKILELLDFSDEGATLFDFVKKAMLAVPALAKAAIAATTDLKPEEVETLDFEDALEIADAIVELNSPEKFLPKLKKVLGLVPRIVGS